jgi:hypothetical protein
MVNCNNAYIRNIIILGSKMKKVLLDSVIVGKLNHDLRGKLRGNSVGNSVGKLNHEI